MDALLQHIEDVERSVNNSGELKQVADLVRGTMRDSHVRALLKTRTAGLTNLPALYGGSKVAAKRLGSIGQQGVSGFDQQIPPSELEKMLNDCFFIGAGVGTLVPDGDSLRLVRRRPEFLRWRRGQWSYNQVDIEPGDGTWVLLAEALECPWDHGAWKSLCRTATSKLLAHLNRLGYVASLANGALQLIVPQGTSEEDVTVAMEDLANFASSNVMLARNGSRAEMLESKNSVGVSAFADAINACNDAIALEICGQTVLTNGAGGAFQNLSVFRAIRQDLIKSDANLINRLVDEQIMPFIAPGCTRVIDLTDDGARVVQAQSLVQAASAISALDLIYDDLDLDQLAVQFAVPRTGIAKKTPDTTAASDTTEPTEPADGEAPVVDTKIALNGAQVSSLLEVINLVVQGQLPRQSAVAIIAAAFNLDDAVADKLLGEVGKSFEPAPLPGNTPAPAPDSGDDE